MASNRRYKAAGIILLFIFALMFCIVWAAELGVKHGRWNELIHERCVREPGKDAHKCP
jgi:hypothetical protein